MAAAITWAARSCEECTTTLQAALRSEKSEEIRELADRIHQLKERMGRTEGWELQREEDGISVYYRQEAGSPFVCLRAECDIDAPIFDILALLYEVRVVCW